MPAKKQAAPLHPPPWPWLEWAPNWIDTISLYLEESQTKYLSDPEKQSPKRKASRDSYPSEIV